jgi:3-demethoxyubiquinol 3-hydroxylase
MFNSSHQDKCIMHFDRALKTLCGGLTATRDNPGDNINQPKLTQEEQQLSAALMRVNHVGEICAQALYQAQAIATNDQVLAAQLQDAANEEVDHLAWTQERITQLGSHTSYLGPLWYIGSFTLGYIAASCGDNWSLGFIAETEYQVTSHLEDYMQKLPSNDHTSYTIMQTMRNDEMQHAENAITAGASELPLFIKTGMQALASIMKAIAFKI